MSFLYLDYNATTPVVPEAREAVLDALGAGFGNPSSDHEAGRRAKAILETARTRVAAAVGADPARVVFESGATEAIHHAVHAAGPGVVLASAVEHPALLAAVRARPDRTLEAIPVDGSGRIDPDGVLRRAGAGVRPALVAVMAAQNETGVLQPVAELVGPLRERGIPFLVDAVQQAGKLPLDFEAPDWLVVTGHKLGGPKGAGALVVRDGVPLPPLLDGGGQEGGRRGGTEPIPAIAGFGAAIDLVRRTRDDEAKRLRVLRDTLEEALLEALPGARVVGREAPRLPNTLSLLLPPGADGAAAVTALDRRRIGISAGSACHAGARHASRVLLAMGIAEEACFRAIRISLGRDTTEDGVGRVLEELPAVVREIRGA